MPNADTTTDSQTSLLSWPVQLFFIIEINERGRLDIFYTSEGPELDYSQIISDTVLNGGYIRGDKEFVPGDTGITNQAGSCSR